MTTTKFNLQSFCTHVTEQIFNQKYKWRSEFKLRCIWVILCFKDIDFVNYFCKLNIEINQIHNTTCRFKNIYLFLIYFKIKCLCVPQSLNRTNNPLEQELQEAVNLPTEVLGTRLRSSPRVVNILKPLNQTLLWTTVQV